MNARFATGQTPPRVLVACIGNIFLGDDGFGAEVARQLAGHTFPDGVEVVDFGIRGVELAYTLLDGCDTLVLVDALPRGGAPGALYLIEPAEPRLEDASATEVRAGMVDAHSMDPLRVLAFAYRLGARPRRVLIVGCEPATPTRAEDYGDIQVGLSEPVWSAVGEAVSMVERVIEEVCRSNAPVI